MLKRVVRPLSILAATVALTAFALAFSPCTPVPVPPPTAFSPCTPVPVPPPALV